MNTTSENRLVQTVHLATAWWVVFAGFSFYWVAGEFLGLATLGEGITSLAEEGETWFMGLVALTGVLKLVPAVFALSLIQPWGERIPLKIRLVVIGGVGLDSMLYGGVNMGVKLVALLGFISVEEVGSTGFWGHLLIWDPVFIFGGVLLCVAAWLKYT